jgi:hypothetical protein
MHVAATPTGKTGFFAKDFSRHFVKVYTLGDGLVVWAMGGCHDIVFVQMGANPNSDWLLAIRQVHFTWNWPICHTENG